MQPIKQIPEGERTKTIYTLIKDQKYNDAIQYLNYELQFTPRSRTLSLLAYCYYMKQDFSNACKIYEQLVSFYPEVEEYKLYLAQTYYKDADLTLSPYKIRKKEIEHAKSLIRQGDPEDPDNLINEGCILYKEEKFEEARHKFQEAINKVGYNTELAYNIALCHYKLKQLAPSLENIAKIIEKGVREHPELGVGSNAEGIEVKSVGNSQALKETALIEAFNLKAAIEYQIKNIPAAKEALLDMPPRSEEELDPVTLMNQALMNMDDKPSDGFKTADVLAENTDLTFKIMKNEDFEFIDALILQNASPEEAFRRFEILSNKSIDNLRKITKDIQDARLNRDNESIKKSLKNFDDQLEKYIPVLMAMAKIYWDRQNYQAVEKLFKQSAEFCADHEVWKLNVAQVFFVQDNKFQEALKYFEPIVKRYSENLLQLQAMVIANLCVSYIMVNQNEDAEELMKKLEREEEKSALQEPEKNVYHLCIVNLVIGTLYCAKNNYEFGISRIIKSLEPLNKKVNTDTWYYAKRCFCSLIETMAKQQLVLKDASIVEMLEFLDTAELQCKNIPTVINPLEQLDEKKTVSYEARMLKRMFYKLRC
ncbi:tetratricopeptide repeat protein [Ichthyophthirius multifiliis]|uniref:Tetratricopeptide repeat protein n=1 Tax=Ichthyophthirius multifiliis TaxID=5932 RepID=G0QQQ3_ICHMU|nr:tetratricopeptide repeat protein [Ichthyophthirius multifiliis]EGR32453.1 tetratricopeptide repeat protein [Ichthyophthirius multifiliis]|eukprot:XP_004036439.1 tetratricopeptide repeat protein [Ichthyophthirius multifiliis]